MSHQYHWDQHGVVCFSKVAYGPMGSYTERKFQPGDNFWANYGTHPILKEEEPLG